MVLGAAFLVFGLVSAMRADGGSSTRLRARLTGQAIQKVMPEGNADFRNDSGRMRLQVEVEQVHLPANTMLSVMIQDGANPPMRVGQITLSASGFGELELDSQDGATVLAVQNGDVVSVTANGTAILAGVFGPK
jgi:hypothetical protein